VRHLWAKSKAALNLGSGNWSSSWIKNLAKAAMARSDPGLIERVLDPWQEWAAALEEQA